VDDRIDRLVLDHGARRDGAEVIVVLPISHRPDGPGGKSAAAVGTNVADDLVDAPCTKRAFERANARVERIGWERLVAMLAGRPQRERFDDIVVFVTDPIFAANLFLWRWAWRL